MKMKTITYLILLTIFVHSLGIAQKTKVDTLKYRGPYLGQATPGATPELFAPGLISLGYHEHRMAISPDGKEIYYSVFGNEIVVAKIMYTRLENGSWTMPRVAPFSDKGMNLHPSFTPDGKKFFFTSTRPRNDSSTTNYRADIWYVERVNDSWTKPTNLGDKVNSIYNDSSPSVMADGTLFFESTRNEEKNLDIYYSVIRNGEYQVAEKLASPINTEYQDGSPFIDPDGKYLLFCSNRPESLGQNDLFISFRTFDGNWSTPRNLGRNINSEYMDWSPCVTPDKKYIIFSSYRNIEPIVPVSIVLFDSLKTQLGTPKVGNGTFYWVSAKIIDELKPHELK